MGYLTTITLYNDALHEFKNDPVGFAKALFDGIDRANYEHREVSVPFHNHANYIDVHPSRHADDETLYLHSGNSVSSMNKYDYDFKELIERNPKLAESFLKRAQRIITESRKQLTKNPAVHNKE